MVPMELSGPGPLRGMKPRISYTITHPAILMRSCIGMCLYTIILILLHIQNIPLSVMAMACLQNSLLKRDDSYRLGKTWVFPEIN